MRSSKLSCLLAEIVLVMLSFGLNAEEIKAKVIKVTGNVLYKSGSGSWQALKLQMELSKDCSVQTKEKSSISLEIPGKGVVIVHELSSIELTSIDRNGKNFSVKMKIFFGKVWNRFNPADKDEESSLSLEAPAAVAAVRGTSFFVESDQATKTARIGVWEGEVAVTGLIGGEKKVDAGYEIIVLYNKPIQDPIKMQIEELRRERELQEDIQKLGVAAMFPAARRMLEANDMLTNQANDTLNNARAQMKGEQIAREDFKKLKLAIARLYADTGYQPGKDVSGGAVRKGARNSLTCLLKNEDRRGVKILGWKGPYIDSNLRDPFGTQYGVYLRKTPRGSEFIMLYSLGVDKLPSNDDVEEMYKLEDLKQTASAKH